MGRGRFSANADVVVAAEALSAYTAAVDTAAGKVGLSGFTRLNGAFYRQQRASAPLGAWDPEQKWDLWLCGMVLLSAALQQWTLSDICSKKPSLESVYVESCQPADGSTVGRAQPGGRVLPAVHCYRQVCRRLTQGPGAPSDFPPRRLRIPARGRCVGRRPPGRLCGGQFWRRRIRTPTAHSRRRRGEVHPALRGPACDFVDARERDSWPSSGASLI